jgi:hypothetical protein
VRPRLIILLCLLASAPLLVTTSASAHFDRDSSTWYTFDVSNCQGPADEVLVDPINAIFYNWGTWGRVASQVGSHAHWHDDGGSAQWFRDHGQCYPMHTQRASAGLSHTRFHIRIRGQHEDESLRWAAGGDAHFEDIVNCPGWWPPANHAVRENGGPYGSGFDIGRDQLVFSMSQGGHNWDYQWRGNTRSFRQCDSQYASSDGYVAWISLHQVNH